MLERKLLTYDDSAAVHTFEALVAAILIVSTLSWTLALHPTASPAGPDDLRALSSDLLNVLEYRGNLPDHPDLAHVIDSQESWDANSPLLDTDVRSMLPPGTKYYLTTQFGFRGDAPPESVQIYVRTFEAFRSDEKVIAEGKLMVWRC